MPDNEVYNDTSMKEIVLDDLEEKKVQFLENPLPVPKRREHKALEFAIDISDDDDFDIKDIPENDDFDIQ